MSYLFFDMDNFNGDISNWDVSNVKRMSQMFRGCRSFNQDISDWDVSNVKDMYQSAMTIMDYSGRIVAMVGGAGEKTQNRSNNRAVSAVRQPGSSIKPISIYAPAIEEDAATYFFPSEEVEHEGTWLT